MSSNTNPGNFANRPHEEVSRIAQQGGQSSHQGGFASMDPSKQTSHPRVALPPVVVFNLATSAREAGQKGGHASSGSFEPGDERAKEAGHKGGLGGPSE
ncbi:uncharacterized protein N7482_001268 [Penicillium canariense]|uniref:Conidiation-specific protein 10 n=1 Tax=Penicillium canariense TaxID=189055 RepID=A0A9W9IJG3_9EURO|nr:uncharacterized protein N7482_001268 [Penicillium canariense]KAJ5175391.1 hypothetical protein N7482_001268 [Penicillium canariense]